jgi:hypothetical protein
MIPQLPPYTPAEYLPGSFGRYRQYPRSVRAQIPGTGYDVGQMVWAEQELNLSGGRPQEYGNYAKVPLRGLGASAAFTFRFAPQFPLVLPAGAGDQGIPAATETTVEEMTESDRTLMDMAAQLEADAAAQAQVPEVGFMSKKVGPVPAWVLALGGVAVAGGGAWWLTRRKKVKPNRRRRRR